ncbi:MAG: hypothetical protein HOO90_03070 [Methylotenera sp.]|uniref:plasmid recombination protein n=1 Tax=Methylotenera sp. TaxID=2051956 RepID=UPI001797CE40|nr:plasmid recombination protein [Methylotenera sp.]NOU24498.1 hypothetical protein [Methylotenera sp.]
MASSHIIRLGKIRGENGVLVALKHNKRALPKDKAHIDSNRTHLNYSLASAETPEALALHAKVQMLKAGIEKPRKDQVKAVEVIYSLPNERHNQNTKQFFLDCYDWTIKTFGGELLSFEVHLDEAAPHAHAIILPLIEGKMRGSAMVGGTANLMRFINKFHADVARNYGMSRSKARLSKEEKLALEKLIIARLKDDPVMLSNAWPFFRDAIHKDPLPCAQALSIELPLAVKKDKSFIDIKRSKGRGSFIR